MLRAHGRPPVTLRLVGGALLLGGVVLFPGYVYLLRTFKRTAESVEG